MSVTNLKQTDCLCRKKLEEKSPLKVDFLIHKRKEGRGSDHTQSHTDTHTHTIEYSGHVSFEGKKENSALICVEWQSEIT